MYNKKSIVKKVLHFPLVKIIISFTVIAMVMGLIQSFGNLILSKINLTNEIKNLFLGISSATAVLISYYYFFKFYEKREITELSKTNLIKDLLLGIIIGLTLQSLTILIMYLNDSFYIISINPIIYILPSLTMAFTSAITEEVLFRGVLYRITEEKLGSYIALLISGLIFGLMHYSNPNSSLGTALGLAIQAGLLLGAAYIYTKKLWLPIALHFAWNFSQSGIFGASTSGHTISESLLTTKIEGLNFITGGNFGPEGSIQATLFCLTATIFLMYLSHKKNNIVKPFWTNK